MLTSMQDRWRRARAPEVEDAEAAEAGFTLIELMVVLLIIAILLAIAIPTFLGVTSSANNRAAQANLTNGLTEAASQYQNNNQSFGGVLAELQSSAPEFAWTSGDCKGSTSPNCLSVDPVSVASSGDNEGLIITSWSAPTATCWALAELEATPQGGTGMFAGTGVAASGTFYAKQVNASSCEASNYASGKTWGPSFTNAGAN